MSPGWKTWCGFAMAATVAASTPCAGVTLLFPGEGNALARGQSWLVFRSEGTARVLVEGNPVEPRRREQGVYHIALPPIAGPDAFVIIRAEPGGERRIPFVDPGEGAFHGQGMRAECASCHDGDESSCSACHRWGEQGKHGEVLGQGCSRCHAAPRWAPRDTEEICSTCHEAFRDGKHPGLRHAVAAPSDPLRPGRRLECVSCHDPHAPQCLGCLSRGELRSWCLTCHRTP